MVLRTWLRPVAGVAGLLLVGGLIALAAPPAAVATPAPAGSVVAAEAASVRAAGGSASDGTRTLRIDRATGLDPAGSTVTVTGSGYDESKGIYVAVCVDNGPGAVPSPCIGGVDMSGGSGGSVWVSSNPPPYGEGLAQPYGPGGTFTVTLAVVARDPITGTDCRETPCAVITRNDHTRPQDRSQDLRIPISFAAPKPPAPPTSEKPAPTTDKPSAPDAPRPSTRTVTSGASPSGAAGPVTTKSPALSKSSSVTASSSAASSAASSPPPAGGTEATSEPAETPDAVETSDAAAESAAASSAVADDAPGSTAPVRSDAVDPAANTTDDSGFPVVVVVLIVVAVAVVAAGGVLLFRRQHR